MSVCACLVSVGSIVVTDVLCMRFIINLLSCGLLSPLMPFSEQYPSFVTQVAGSVSGCTVGDGRVDFSLQLHGTG